MIGFLISTLTQGALYSLVAFGVYITYSVLNFPDLSVDGTFPLGAALTAGLLLRGANPWAALAAALAAGMLAGAFTGVVHVVFRVRDLLAGIITQTALFSVNLLINGTSNVALERSAKTIFQMGDVLGGMSLGTRRLIVALAIALAVKLLLDLYFRTKSGLLLRAVGDNAALVTALGKNMGAVKILGLALSNGLVALAGGIGFGDHRYFSVPEGVLCPGDNGGIGGKHPVQGLHPGGHAAGLPALYAEICYGYAVFVGAGPVRTEGRDDHSCLSLYR